jgi:hypothetical protein
MTWTESKWHRAANTSKKISALKSFDEAAASIKCVQYIADGADFSQYHANGTCALLCFAQIDCEDGHKVMDSLENAFMLPSAQNRTSFSQRAKADTMTYPLIMNTAGAHPPITTRTRVKRIEYTPALARFAREPAHSRTHARAHAHIPTNPRTRAHAPALCTHAYIPAHQCLRKSRHRGRYRPAWTGAATPAALTRTHARTYAHTR